MGWADFYAFSNVNEGEMVSMIVYLLYPFVDLGDSSVLNKQG